MRFRIVRTHRRGILLPKREISRSAGIVGELTTADCPDDLLRGTVTVASLKDPASGAQRNELLPPLYIATLRLIAPQGLLLSGLERIDDAHGSQVAFAQGWWARPL